MPLLDRVINNDLDELKTYFDLRSEMGRLYPDNYPGEGENSLCIFHEERTPSMLVEKDHLHCFGCHKHADVYDLYRARYNCSLQEAIQMLKDLAGVNGGNRSQEPGKEAGKPDFAKRFRFLLRSPIPQNAIDYLTKTRALSSKLVQKLIESKRVAWSEKKNALTFPVITADQNNIIGLQYIPIDGTDKTFAKFTDAGIGYFFFEDKSQSLDFLIVTEVIIDGLSAMDACPDSRMCSIFSASTVDKISAISGQVPVIFFDSDKAGKEATLKAINKFGQRIRVVDWGMAPQGHKDVNDLLRAGQHELISRMIRASRVPDNKVQEGSPEPPSIRDIILKDSNFITIKIPAKGTLLYPWLYEQSIILITGWRGIGKTWFALLIVDAVTRLKPFGRWNSETSVPCLYLDGEMAAQDVMERFEQIGTRGRVNPLYIYSDAYAAAMGLSRANLLDEKCRDGMKEFLLEKNIKLWVVDNVASLTPGIDENSKSEWDVVNSWLLGLRFAGISAILLHHEGKDGRQRGTSGREDNIDISISLQKPVDYFPEDGARFVAHFSKHRIRTRDLPLIADTEFKIMDCGEDGIACVWKDAKKQKKLEIIRLSDEGVSVGHIAKIVGVAKSYVTKVRQEAIKDVILSESGKLTQLGYSKLNSQFGERNR